MRKVMCFAQGSTAETGHALIFFLSSFLVQCSSYVSCITLSKAHIKQASVLFRQVVNN